MSEFEGVGRVDVSMSWEDHIPDMDTATTEERAEMKIAEALRAEVHAGSQNVPEVDISVSVEIEEAGE